MCLGNTVSQFQGGFVSGTVYNFLNLRSLQREVELI